MYEANVTKNACKSVSKLKALFEKGIREPLAQVMNPRIKKKAQQIAIGKNAVFCGCVDEDIIYFSV